MNDVVNSNLEPKKCEKCNVRQTVPESCNAEKVRVEMHVLRGVRMIELLLGPWLF